MIDTGIVSVMTPPGTKTTVPEAATKSLPAVAVPATVDHVAVTVPCAGPESETTTLAVVVPLLPSVTWMLEIETVGSGMSPFASRFASALL